MAIKAIDACSPDDSSTSISRLEARGDICWPRLSSRSVSPAIAETTTTTRSPAATKRAMRSATALMRSISPTDVPPYFCTSKRPTDANLQALGGGALANPVRHRIERRGEPLRLVAAAGASHVCFAAALGADLRTDEADNLAGVDAAGNRLANAGYQAHFLAAMR